MTTNVDGRPPATGSANPTMPIASIPPDTYRPARPDHGLGRWFRRCAGVEEDILDWTPSERAKYAGFGIIIFNTGCLAALAMFTALGKVLAAPAIALLLIALVWGWMIFSIDRWLVTSTHGVVGHQRVLILIPRLILAILVAFTIAEPLTLRIFQNTLDSTVATTRTTQLDSYASQLRNCNPVSGAWVTAPSCDGYHLNVTSSPSAVAGQLASARQVEAQLQDAVNAAQSQSQAATTLKEGECSGTAGPDLTGAAGDGPMCKSDTATAQADAAGLATKQRALNAQQATVDGLISRFSSEQQVYGGQVTAAITSAVSEKRADLNKQIGIIDEWGALEQLSQQSTFVSVGHWLLVLVLLALDCLPVLAKLMSGSCAYDRLLARQRSSDEQIYDIDLQFRVETATIEQEIGIYSAQNRKRDWISDLKLRRRVKSAEVESDGLDDVRAQAARWIREAEAHG